MLVMDGHGSHLTPQFDDICQQNQIIPICMPAHSSHLLQPLDIGCFAVTKRSYGQYIQTKIRHGVTHIDKLDFLSCYPQARTEAYKPMIIANSFAGAGLIPYSPQRVLDKLDIQLRTPTPPPPRGSATSREFVPHTPCRPVDIRRQASSIKTLLR